MPADSPIYHKPGKNPDELAAAWDFQVRTGLNGRILVQMVDLLATTKSRQTGATALEKKVVSRPDGRQIGILLYREPIDGVSTTKRQYFFQLDADSLVTIRELASDDHWKEYAEALSEISDSADVTKN